MDEWKPFLLLLQCHIQKDMQQKKVAQSLGEQKLWLGVIQSTEKPAEIFDCTFEWENEFLFSGAC